MGRSGLATRLAALAAFVLLAVVASPASASEIVDRSALNPTLEVTPDNTALVSYTSHGVAHHVLFWGGVNWADQFSRDYSGGWKSHRADWAHFHNSCGPYTGPALPLLVEACDAPDGSHWALQDWARLWDNYGGHDAPMELHLSHWTGDAGVLTVRTDWGYHGRFQHLYGTFTYHGRAVFGTRWTRQGVPLDRQGRNVYVDYLSTNVWLRENSFLTHPNTGGFCYLFSPHAGRIGNGSAYRATAIGPGVSPIVRTEFAPPPAFDETVDAQANQDQQQLLGPDTRCTDN
jgi:hypothetical protein